MKKNHLLLLVFFTITNIFAQKRTAEQEVATYFVFPREAVHLHLNKTKYFSGEEIWFQGYAYDTKNQLLSKATTNVNVGIYDSEGKQLKKQLLRAKDGLLQGNFLVDSTYNSGTYYIKADTNWMQNFEEKNAYVQKIEIFADTTPETVSETYKNESNTTVTYTENLQKAYDFQFLPEGGHLIENTQNSIGFKLINSSGKSTTASGVLINDSGNKVASFETNARGMGKFLFVPKAGENYTAKIKLSDETTFTKAFPKAEKYGISMILNNPFSDKIILSFNTNQTTLSAYPSKKYKVLIHQNGKSKLLDFTFDSGLEKTMTVEKETLFKGINIVTVFDENETPVLERLFFNDYFLKDAQLNVNVLNVVEDSVLLSVNELKLDENVHLSMSVLHENTISYTPKNSIISSFYLQPYVKGTIENPKYYFDNMDGQKKYELDILLLTQGWSRYDWKQIFVKTPSNLHRFETGITLTGTVNVPSSGVDRLFLHATKNHSAQFLELDKNQKFAIKNFYPEAGEEIRFSYIDKKGIFKKPGMFLRYDVYEKNDEIPEALLEKDTRKIYTKELPQIVAGDFVKDSETLDTIVVSAKKEKNESVFERSRLLRGNTINITANEYALYNDIGIFLQAQGYRVTQNLGRFSITTQRRPVAIPTIFYDGVRLNDLSILYGFSLANVEKIVIDKTGFGYGMTAGFGGVIHIFTRRTPLFDSSAASKRIYHESVVPYAFSAPKTYYMPKYNSYFTETFEKYGSIAWFPNVEVKTGEAANLKMFDTRRNSVVVYIEGISESGTLISVKKTLKLR